MRDGGHGRSRANRRASCRNSVVGDGGFEERILVDSGVSLRVGCGSLGVSDRNFEERILVYSRASLRPVAGVRALATDTLKSGSWSSSSSSSTFTSRHVTSRSSSTFTFALLDTTMPSFFLFNSLSESLVSFAVRLKESGEGRLVARVGRAFL
jgi:hypothetical protein